MGLARVNNEENVEVHTGRSIKSFQCSRTRGGALAKCTRGMLGQLHKIFKHCGIMGRRVPVIGDGVGVLGQRVRARGDIWQLAKIEGKIMPLD